MKRLMFLVSTKGKTDEEIADEVLAAQAKFLVALRKAREEEEAEAKKGKKTS